MENNEKYEQRNHGKQQRISEHWNKKLIVHSALEEDEEDKNIGITQETLVLTASVKKAMNTNKDYRIKSFLCQNKFQPETHDRPQTKKD